ncbi:protein LONGIFOLIA 1 [Striga asiatica]|uniref:Protein LONGIFOLIA 1 n=1 Tax=Striga asiatica TaxID=4170 RepID=A0A5A7RER3_STRAF|nr:protein LONGIFOLIA 1 [Striga asiatica]
MTTEKMMKDHNQEKQLQKQMGCMVGWLHIFDRHRFLTGKRFYSAAGRLPSSPAVDISDKSTPPSPANSTELEDPASKQHPAAAELLSKQASSLPAFELKERNRRSRKDAPRLSLDSRATTDAKGSLRPKNAAADGGQGQRSPSVIARLMGLEQLPGQPELRRSASESRVSRDLFNSRFIDALNSNATKENFSTEARDPDPKNYSPKMSPKSETNGGLTAAAPPGRKSFFDSGDVFPARTRQTAFTIYGEIEKRIKTRGLIEPSHDLETLNQILEALQLKGLLHHSKPHDGGNRKLVRDGSPIVLIKPPPPTSINFSPANRSNRVRRHVETPPTVSPRRERNARSPTRAGRSPSPTSRSSSLVKPKPSGVETRTRRTNKSAENRGASPANSPKPNARRSGTDPTAINRSPRCKKTTQTKGTAPNAVVFGDESSSISGSSSSITTSTDTEGTKSEESKEGRNLLERCDQLLHSIAEMSATDPQPSPVSVLDSSFYRDESLTPSPVTTKRNIDFQDELEEEIWSPLISTKCIEASNDSDFIYISEIVKAIHYLPEDSDIFVLLEKQQYLKGKSTSKAARLQRKLIFHITEEIVERQRQLPPWEAKCIVSCSVNDCATPFLENVWSEFERMRQQREKSEEEDLFESICSVLKKDLAEGPWGDFPVEISEAVLDMERLIFKDLICDSIYDLVLLASRNRLNSNLARRKLVF